MDSALPPCVIEQVSSTLSRNPSHDVIPSISRQSFPWGKATAEVETVSFDDVMSEQLAKVLQQEESSEPPERYVDVSPTAAFADSEFKDTCDDFLMAQMLQREFDKEHDEILKHEVKKYNGASKISVSFDKYLRLPQSPDSDEEDDDMKDHRLEQSAQKHWRNFDEAEKALQAVGKSGISQQGNVTTTKHDAAMCGKLNASKLMQFSSRLETGDSHDMQISNKVYNELKQLSFTSEKRRRRVHDKTELATAGKALDSKTHLILYKLIDSEFIESVTGCFSTGKEACIYHATAPPDEDSTTPKECALKIFKTTLNEFQNRDQYVKDDYRFKDRFGHQNPRKVIHLWAKKEMRNLKRIETANIPCPQVIVLRKHVIVMSFIGANMIPAPKLKEIQVPFEDLTIIYEQTVDIMKDLYNKCNLVHADLSEYNLLWHDDKVWVIDVSQAVDLSNCRAHEFLMRDCQNISNFFEKQGVIGVLKPEELFVEVCGETPKDVI